MAVNTKEEFEKLENEVNINETLKGKFTIKKVEKVRTKIIIYSSNKKVDDEELVKSLESQNVA